MTLSRRGFFAVPAAAAAAAVVAPSLARGGVLAPPLPAPFLGEQVGERGVTISYGTLPSSLAAIRPVSICIMSPDPAVFRRLAGRR